MRSSVDISPLAAANIDSIRGEWSELAARATPNPYHTFGWLRGWVEIYEPSALWLLRVLDPGGKQIAIGLLERRAGKRLSFAGAPITPARGLVAAPGQEHEAWSILEDWLRLNPRAWGAIDAAGLNKDEALRHTWRAMPVAWLSMSLPDSFDTYLDGLSSSSRKALVRKLRAAERAAVESVVTPQETIPDHLDAFVEFHRLRASAKGERHPDIDGRLARMLASVRPGDGLEVRLIALRRQQKTFAVTVRLDMSRSSWFYNAGFDPNESQLSPGLVVELASIRDAIESGSAHYDLGPGAYRYKRDLGGVERTCFNVNAASKSTSGRILDLGLRVQGRVGRLGWLRAVLGRQR